MRPGTAISYGILEQDYRASAQRGLHASHHGQGTEAGHGQDPVGAVPSSARCHRALSLLLDDTIALAQSLDTVEVAIMCPAADVDDLAFLAGDAVRVVAQTGEGLAAGLNSVFAHFAAAGHQHIIAFNSDSPHLPASVLESAFEALAAHDLVVGPTHDGGYYLVGARAVHPGLFNGDGMGTSNALETLLARAQALGLSVRFADPFYDIDVASDLIRLDAELRHLLRGGRHERRPGWRSGGRWWRSCGPAWEAYEAHAIPQALRAGHDLARGADDLLTQVQQPG